MEHMSLEMIDLFVKSKASPVMFLVLSVISFGFLFHFVG